MYIYVPTHLVGYLGRRESVSGSALTRYVPTTASARESEIYASTYTLMVALNSPSPEVLVLQQLGSGSSQHSASRPRLPCCVLTAESLDLQFTVNSRYLHLGLTGRASCQCILSGLVFVINHAATSNISPSRSMQGLDPQRPFLNLPPSSGHLDSSTATV